MLLEKDIQCFGNFNGLYTVSDGGNYIDETIKSNVV